jgi:uncharacterized protein (UPF0335 family)
MSKKSYLKPDTLEWMENKGGLNESEVRELINDVKRLHKENKSLQDDISSHGPEGRNYTNAQYVRLLQERESLKLQINQAAEMMKYMVDASADMWSTKQMENMLSRIEKWEDKPKEPYCVLCKKILETDVGLCADCQVEQTQHAMDEGMI